MEKKELHGQPQYLHVGYSPGTFSQSVNFADIKIMNAMVEQCPSQYAVFSHDCGFSSPLL